MSKELDTAEVVRGSGNVFVDLGLPATEQDMLKVAIAAAITQTIQERKLTQVEAATLMEADQPKVSAITRGQLKGLAVERLFKYLLLLGRDVDIRISDDYREETGRLKVVGA
jgi:predicted XRE-type DNA-binding protein